MMNKKLPEQSLFIEPTPRWLVDRDSSGLNRRAKRLITAK